MATITQTNEKIPKVTFVLNFIFLIISLFHISKTATILFLIINMILLGTYVIINKYSALFNVVSGTNKIAQRLSKRIEVI